MSRPRNEGQTPPGASRSRWRRFSPSMGWRAFWSEIVIVVLGVVIALAANEAAQDWSWRHKVEDADGRLRSDLAWAFLWSAEMYASQPCLETQLSVLSRAASDSGQTLTPQPVLTVSNVRLVARMPFRSFRFPAWDALVADGTATHLSPKRQAFLGNVGDSMAQARRNQEDILRLQARLMVMRSPIPLDPAVRAGLLADIEALRLLTSFEALNAQQRMRLIADEGGAPSADTVGAFLTLSGTNASSSEFSGTVQYCTAHGLPLADWRDYRKATVSAVFHPPTGAGK